MILGNKVTSLTVDELHKEIKSTILKDGKELILNTNTHGMNLAYKHQWLRDFRNSAKIVHCDGSGVIWAARILGFRIDCRITVHDWISDLANLCQSNDFSLYFLGAKPGIAERAAQNLLKTHLRLRIVGTHHGYFMKEGSESVRVINRINEVKPDILIVGFGMPDQEKWIKENWGQIQAHVFLAGGGCFDVLSGALPRCPKFFANLGFEWLFRLSSEPKRLFNRYIIGNTRFMFHVFLEKAAFFRNGGKKRRLPSPRT